MKLTAEIDGGKRAIDLRREGARVVAEIDGRRYEVEAREPEAGVYLLISDHHVYECRVGAPASPQESQAFNVHVGNHTYQVFLTDPKRLAGAQSFGTQASGRAKVVAAIPGKVVRVLVEPGARVAEGEGLVVVEAMKMQNEIKSPKAGTIDELHALAGATVRAGDVLVIVE